jgi:sporulation protein YlmC with PRC-barrel domain
MDRTYSFGGIVMVIGVAIVCATAASRAQVPNASPDPNLEPELLASDLIGRPVRTANGESVGEISDLVLSPADKVSSAVVSVGGFFGIGARQVEVPYALLVVAANRSTVLVTISKDQVTSKPEFSSDDHRSQAATGADPHSATDAAPPATAPTAQLPDAAARAQANAEAEESFATDDPRVAKGLAENKEAYDRDEQGKKRAPLP